jgi:uncharacterized protein
MKKLIILTSCIFLLFIIGAIGNLNKSDWVTIEKNTFRAEFADTDKAKTIGLSKYNSIEEDFAMVFEFEDGASPTFWMKGMKFPIDIIFVNDSKIVHIYKNANPPKSDDEELELYRAPGFVDTVIEIRAGLSDRYNFKKGDNVKIER